jgi:hypothetical protein
MVLFSQPFQRTWSLRGNSRLRHVGTPGQRLPPPCGSRADAELREYSETATGHQLPSGAQIRQVGENLRVALEAADLGLKDLVKTTTYVTDMDVTGMDEFFKYHSKRPTRWRT